jgi:hypothetical protein
MKSTYNLVDDIYKLVESKEVAEGVDIESCIEQFGENVKDLMRKEFTEVRDDSRKLRMSNIGTFTTMWTKGKTYSHTLTSSSSMGISLKNYYCFSQELLVTL